MNSTQASSSGKGPNHLLWIIGLLALIGLLFMSRGLVRFIPTVIAPALFITLVFWIWKNWPEKKPSATQSIIDEINSKIQNCEIQLKDQYQDLEEINDTVQDLQRQLNGAYELNQKSWVETQQLLKAFEEEEKIRLQKIDFFKTLKKNLNTLLYNHQAIQKIQEKRNRLNQLRADHYDDLAEMEALKQGFAYDQGFLESIQQLSLQMIQTKHLDKVADIREEFDKIIDELSDRA